MQLYEIEFAPASKRQFKKLPRNVQIALAEQSEFLSQDPWPANAKKLSLCGRDLWRVREGDYWVVYEIRDEVLLVLLVKVGHRREVYRRLENLR